MTPTIKEIAKKANVSIATVSRALNNDKRVTDETRNLIHSIAEELNYKPNILARNFVRKKSNIIGLILPDIFDEFFTEIIKGVDEVTFQHGVYTMVASSHKFRSLEESLASLLRNGLVGGLILLIPSLSKEIKSILDQTKMPFVLISGGVHSSIYDVVSIDNYQGAYDMTNYLIKKRGYTKIAHITGPKDNDDSKLREKGFIDACSENQITVRKNFLVRGDFTRESGIKLGMDLLSLKNGPQVIFAANDMMALGCYDAAQKKGLSIPEDIAVVGFDDIFVSQYLNPSLTTVRVQIEEVGKSAATLLMSRMYDDSKKPGERVKINTELVIRESC